MKIIYIVPINFDKYDGVVNKIKSQVTEWINLGNQVNIVILTSSKERSIEDTSLSKLSQDGLIKIFYIKKIKIIPLDLIYDWMGLKSAFSDALEFINDYNPDIVYTRSFLYQPYFSKIGKKYNLIVESNTNVKAEFYLQRYDSFKFFLRFLYHKWTDKAFLKNVAGIAAVTTEIASNYSNEIPKAVFPNGINVNEYGVDCYTYPISEKRIFFIGTPGMPWQGVDIICELAKKMRDVKFDIVGINDNKSEKYPNNIIFYGFQNKESYLKLLEKATAAIGTMALFRKNMEEACPLKVREYIAVCRPLIISYKETAFEQESYPEWVLKLENNKESILNSTKIIQQFLDNCKEFKINQDAIRKYVDVKFIEKKRIDFFIQIEKNSNLLS